MSFSFDYKNYIQLLLKMKEIASIYKFESIKTGAPDNGFILRHDIDLSIIKALEMAKIEYTNDVKGTYFFLITSEYYNVNAPINRQSIKEIRDMGHEVGLHFDPTVYKTLELIQAVENEVAILEQIIGEKVNSISLHNPSIHGEYPEFLGYLNAYSSKFFNSSRYISDSCKNFRGKDIFEYIERGREMLLQIVLHPIHFSSKSQTYHETIYELVMEKTIKFDENMRVNKTYNDEMRDFSLWEYFLNNKNKKC